MNVKRYALLRAGISLLALTAATNTAFSQTSDAATNTRVRDRFQEASRLMKSDKLAAACPMLEEVVTIAPNHSAAKLSLADCYARTGRLASASRLYAILEQEATDQGQDAARRIAAEKRSAIEPRISHLRVVVPEGLSQSKDLVILHDGERVYPEQWGISVPVDRGPHTIEARLANETPWKKAIDIWQDGAIIDVTIDMPVPYRPGNVLTTSALAAKPEAPKSAPETKGFWSTGRMAGMTAAGFGVVGLGLGIGFGVAAISKQNESNDGPCNEQENTCTPEGMTMRKETMALGNVSTAMFVAGSILAVGGATLLIVSPGKGGRRTPTVGVGPSGFVVSGTF